MTEDLSYPIGKFKRVTSLSDSEWNAGIATLTTQAARLRSAITGLDDSQLDSPYRPGGWTVRQLVHHVADSHVNMYIRLKVALTEDNPTIKPYDQDAWVLLADIREVPITTSLHLLESVQERSVSVLRNCSAADRERPFMHPETGQMNVAQLVALYSWHGDHHIAHVTNLRLREGW